MMTVPKKEQTTWKDYHKGTVVVVYHTVEEVDDKCCTIICPFCQDEVTVAKFALETNGRRCDSCGAIHTGNKKSFKKLRKVRGVKSDKIKKKKVVNLDLDEVEEKWSREDG